jgi:hypothetical protein
MSDSIIISFNKKSKEMEIKKNTNQNSNEDSSRSVNHNFVKKPVSGYQMYIIDRMPAVKQEFGDLKQPEKLAKIAQEWKKLDNEAQNDWKKKAIPHFEEYKKKINDGYVHKPKKIKNNNSNNEDSVKQPKKVALIPK